MTENKFTRLAVPRSKTKKEVSMLRSRYPAMVATLAALGFIALAVNSNPAFAQAPAATGPCAETVVSEAPYLDYVAALRTKACGKVEAGDPAAVTKGNAKLARSLPAGCTLEGLAAAYNATHKDSEGKPTALELKKIFLTEDFGCTSGTGGGYKYPCPKLSAWVSKSEAEDTGKCGCPDGTVQMGIFCVCDTDGVTPIGEHDDISKKCPPDPDAAAGTTDNTTPTPGTTGTPGTTNAPRSVMNRLAFWRFVVFGHALWHWLALLLGLLILVPPTLRLRYKLGDKLWAPFGRRINAYFSPQAKAARAKAKADKARAKAQARATAARLKAEAQARDAQAKANAAAAAAQAAQTTQVVEPDPAWSRSSTPRPGAPEPQ